jgi:hypothetical protein
MENKLTSRNTDLPKIYVLVNQSQIPTENQFEVLAVFKNKKDAEEALKKQYSDDLEWILKQCGCKEKDLDENHFDSCTYHISKDVYFAISYIEIVYLH